MGAEAIGYAVVGFLLILVVFQAGTLPLLGAVLAVLRYKPRVVYHPRLALRFTLLLPVLMALFMSFLLLVELRYTSTFDLFLIALVLAVPAIIASVIYGMSFRSFMIGAAPHVTNFVVLAAWKLLGPSWWFLGAWVPWMLSVVVVGYLVLRRRPGWKYQAGMCRACGYNLIGHPLNAMCPECGTIPYPDTPIHSASAAEAPTPVDIVFCATCWYDRSELSTDAKCPNCGARPK